MDETELLTIGQTARRAGTTTRALRHYDRLGLFVPAAVDAATSHRFYAGPQLDDLQLLVALRAVEVPLDEVRACLAHAVGPDRDGVVADVLGRHRVRLEARLTRVQRALHRLDHMRTDITHDGAHTQMTDSLDHARIGADLFNRTWTLMEREDRSVADDDTMLHMAHASRHHWGQAAGAGPERLARGEWQISRVYSVLRRAEPCLHHARRCLQLCRDNGLGDFDLAFAYEALARGSAVAGDLDATEIYRAQALEAATDIDQQEDRELLLTDLATIPSVTG